MAFQCFCRHKPTTTQLETRTTQNSGCQNTTSTTTSKELVAKELEKFRSTINTSLLSRSDVSYIESLIKAKHANRMFILLKPTPTRNYGVFASHEFLAFTGYREEDVVGKSGDELKAMVTGADGAVGVDRLKAAMALETTKETKSSVVRLSTWFYVLPHFVLVTKTLLVFIVVLSQLCYKKDKTPFHSCLTLKNLLDEYEMAVCIVVQFELEDTANLNPQA
eukprot:c2642_g1_i2.p1 GENE.c2642_g1_i2~~c2642_g1_i2.p1  ORF type:complete len:247 (+),score=67.11 c2642_g1_i2:80-742(+)